MKQALIRALLTSVLLLAVFTLYGQASDSLKVYFIGYNPRGEKFKVQYGNEVKLKFRSNGGYKYSFYIPLSYNIIGLPIYFPNSL
jgi:hypothetical protein